MKLINLVLLFFTCIAFGQIKPEVVITMGHNDYIHDLAFSPNGKFFASSSNEKVVKIWDAVNGMEFRTLSGFSGRVDNMSFSPNNIDLACTTSNNELFIINVITGEVIYTSAAGTGFGLSFINRGEALLFLNENNNACVYNLTTNRLKSLEGVFFFSLVTSPAIENIAFGLDEKGDLHKIELANMTHIQKYALFDSPKFPFSVSDISFDGKLLAMGFSDQVIRVFDIEREKIIYETEKLKGPPQTLGFDAKKNYLYYAVNGQGVFLYDYNKNTTEEILIEKAIHFGVQSLASHPNGEMALFAAGHDIVFFDTSTKSSFKTLESLDGRIYDLAYSANSNLMAVATDQFTIQIWDLKYNRVLGTVNGFFPCQFTKDGRGLIAVNQQMNIGVFDLETQKQVKEFNTGGEVIQTIALSNDGKFIAAAGFQNVIKSWNFETTNQLTTLKGHTGGIIALDFSSDGKYLASGSYDGTSRVWDLLKSQEIEKFEDQTIVIGDVKFSPDGKLLATASWDKSICIRNTVDWSLLKKLEGHQSMINSIDFSADSKVLISGAGNSAVSQVDNAVIAWDLDQGGILCQSIQHQTQIMKVIAEQEGSRFFSVSVDGEIKYSDFNTCELIATYRAASKNEFLILAPDNYYIANKAVANKIAFRMGDQLLPFEQYDVLLNRPDILARRIGKSDDNVLDAYYYLYKKRLKRLNIDESNLRLDFNLPTVKIDSEFDIITQDEVQEFYVKLKDDFHALKQLNVLINGVPLYGETGLPIEAGLFETRLKITVPLMDSVNHILISCMNDIGVESLYQNVKIIRKSKENKQNLFVLTIGVADYKDDQYKLVYPVADAKDVLAKFTKQEEMYKHIYSKSLLNEQVVLDSLPGIYSFFERCTHQDFAVIFIAGHGVLNVDLKYFFGTYDMDFNKPEERGLAYEELYELLSKIKAFRKLLIMDTCHSGELDMDEVEEIREMEEVNSTSIQFRNGNFSLREKEGVGFENSVSISKDIFADIRRGSGANVISSAGGTEFALEGSEWGNGLFTHYLLLALDNPAKVGNKDNVLTLYEIKNYVNTEVSRATNNRQQPTSREENLSQDYVIIRK